MSELIDAARGRAWEIRQALTGMSNLRDRVLHLIKEARDAGDHEALGYPSWTAYVAGEFGDLLPKLTRSERMPLATQLRSLGMSTRAIAPVLGTSEGTVRNDLAAATAQDCAVAQPSPEAVTGLIPEVVTHIQHVAKQIEDDDAALETRLIAWCDAHPEAGLTPADLRRMAEEAA